MSSLTTKHYALVSGKVLFHMKDSEDAQEIYLNTTITGDDPNITAVQIARAQQGLQHMLFQKIEGEINVIDVHIFSISKLGQMTEKKFMAGLDKLQAQAAA